MIGRVPDVLVVIPAHNEQDVIRACLTRALAAIDHAQRADAIARARIVVVAHRCTDHTVRIARQVLRDAPVPATVVPDDLSSTVAEVRHRGVRAVSDTVSDPARVWLFNTDADSCVLPDWITATLRATRRVDAVAAAGLVEVVDWQATESARRAYQDLVDAGIGPTGHQHVYGANLAVRLDAYLSVGGFISCAHGEDHELARRLRGAGYPIATPHAPRVHTSGRVVARSPHGLGALLARLLAGS